MLRSRLQAAESLIDGFRGERLQFRACLADHPFGKGRARGDRRRAAADLKTRLDHLSVFKERGQAQQVSAGRIAHIHDDRGRRELADVAGIAEMFEEQFGMHVVLPDHKLSVTHNVAGFESSEQVENLPHLADNSRPLALSSRFARH